MNPELALIVAEEVPVVARIGAEGLEQVAARTVGGKAVGNLLADLAGQFEGLRPTYPSAEQILKEPVQGLEGRFFASRNAIAKSLDPAQALLPQLGLHGTSLEGGARILAGQSANAIDFATFSADSARRGTQTYVSEVGRSMETAVSFSEKWLAWPGKHPGPVFVLDVTKAKALPFADVPIPYPYGGADSAFLAKFFPEAQQFKGTMYGLGQNRFSSIVAGTIDYNATQQARPLVSLLNNTAMEQITDGVPRDKVLAELWQRGQVLDATKRLDLAHQAISKWLLKVS